MKKQKGDKKLKGSKKLKRLEQVIDSTSDNFLSRSVVALAIVMCLLGFRCGQVPLGDEMPMGLWAVDTDSMSQVKADGFNLVYHFEVSAEYMQAASEAGLAVMARIGGGDINNPVPPTAEEIQTLAPFQNLFCWYLWPEEIRWDREEQMNSLITAFDLIKQHDPSRRPIYNYQPANRLPSDVAEYEPYTGIYGMGLYTNNYLMPRQWVRWVMENTVQGIADSGSDMLPIAVPGMFDPEEQGVPPNEETGPPLTGAEMRHDIYLALASGAKGVVAFSYAHKDDDNVGPDVYPALVKIADEMNGAGGLAGVILSGKLKDDVVFQITAGPPTSGEFYPDGYPNLPVTFPSLTIRTLKKDGSIYLIAVNSATSPIEVKFDFGLLLPKSKDRLDVLFENRTVPLKLGEFKDSFDALEVHIYRSCSELFYKIFGP